MSFTVAALIDALRHADPTAEVTLAWPSGRLSPAETVRQVAVQFPMGERTLLVIAPKATRPPASPSAN